MSKKSLKNGYGFIYACRPAQLFCCFSVFSSNCKSYLINLLRPKSNHFSACILKEAFDIELTSNGLIVFVTDTTERSLSHTIDYF